VIFPWHYISNPELEKGFFKDFEIGNKGRSLVKRASPYIQKLAITRRNIYNFAKSYLTHTQFESFTREEDHVFKNGDGPF
jgi:hypothetical protein